MQQCQINHRVSGLPHSSLHEYITHPTRQLFPNRSTPNALPKGRGPGERGGDLGFGMTGLIHNQIKSNLCSHKGPESPDHTCPIVCAGGKRETRTHARIRRDLRINAPAPATHPPRDQPHARPTASKASPLTSIDFKNRLSTRKGIEERRGCVWWKGVDSVEMERSRKWIEDAMALPRPGSTHPPTPPTHPLPDCCVTGLTVPREYHLLCRPN
jgi:hypothetical protein